MATENDGGRDETAVSIARMPAGARPADRRFLAARLGSPGERVELAPGEAHHLARVLRLGPGDRVAVFDGHGREFLAEVHDANRSRAIVTLLEPIVPAPEARVTIAMAMAILKGPAMEAAIRDAVMIGAARLVPVVSAHVAVKGRVLERADTVERWNRIALASAKQCRRAAVPRVEPPVPFAGLVGRTEADVRLIFVEPGIGTDVRTARSLLELASPRSAALLTGPEGGWSRAEVEAARAAGWMPVTLGGLTLRAESMPLCAGALARFLWEE